MDGTLIGPAGCALGRPWALYVGAAIAPIPRAVQDARFVLDTTGTITNNNRVYYKDSGPEQPFAGARVRLHRLQDGYCAWEGISDASGYYHATGLEVGLRYYPVAIDLTGTYECVAAGPVTAVAAS